MVCEYANSESTTIPGIEFKKFPETNFICKSVIISSNYNKISNQQASWNDHSLTNMGEGVRGQSILLCCSELCCTQLYSGSLDYFAGLKIAFVVTKFPQKVINILTSFTRCLLVEIIFYGKKEKVKNTKMWPAWPAFGCCTHPKAGWNTFFYPFSSFFVDFRRFLKKLKRRVK